MGYGDLSGNFWAIVLTVFEYVMQKWATHGADVSYTFGSTGGPDGKIYFDYKV